MMRVRSSRLTAYDLPLASPWHWAGGVWQRRQGWLVELESDDGRIGWGDCPPLPQMGGESLDAAGHALRQSLAALPGQTVQTCLDTLSLPHHPAARYGMETALLDLLAQQAEQPLHRFLSAPSRGHIRVNAMLGHLDQGVIQRAGTAMAHGFTVAKVKLGINDWNVEQSPLLDLLSCCAGRLRLRLDANQAWDAPTALRVVRSLTGLGVEGLEDPLRHPSASWLRRLQDQADFPLAADECLPRLDEQDLLSGRSIQRLVLKPALLGGILPCLSLARRAMHCGITSIITSAVESAVGITACAHLAAALDNDVAHGLDTSRWLAWDVASPPPITKGRMALSDLCGLGYSGMALAISATTE